MRLGLPYMGSKHAHAVEIVKVLPAAEHFYDIFAGGGAIAHAAALSGKYKYIHVNDISDVVWFFKKAIEGGYRDEKRWISRKDFERLKDEDPYVSICWSFGNNRRHYLYSKEVWRKKTAQKLSNVKNRQKKIYF